MSNPFNDPKKSLGDQEGPTPWAKIGIAVALVLAVALLATVVIKARQKLSAPDQTSAEDLSVTGKPTNSVPELPPEVAAAMANNPTNLPDDVTPSAPSAVYPPTAPASAPIAPPVTVPAAPLPAAPLPVAALPPVTTGHRPTVSHYSGAAVVIVHRGDTLWHIARTHGTTVKALKAANGLKSDRILVGQKLKVPRHRLLPARTVRKLVHHLRHPGHHRRG